MTGLDNLTIEKNYLAVMDGIESAAHSVGRDSRDIKLVTVTKGHPLESVLAVIGAGAQHLGENYAEEGVEKILACTAYTHINWHMIGHVQSRKARLVCQYFDCIHSLDSLNLARRLIAALRGFPDDASIAYLKRVGVTHVGIDSRFVSESRMATIAGLPDLRLFATDGNFHVYALR